MQDLKAQERLASYDNMKSHFSSSYRQSYIDMNENRDVVNTNHILSSLTPQKERPSINSFASEGDYNQGTTRIQPLHYRPGASSFVSPKLMKNPLTPVARETMNILKSDRNGSVRQSGTQ